DCQLQSIFGEGVGKTEKERRSLSSTDFENKGKNHAIIINVACSAGKYKDKFYKQMDGMATGSPLSP
uniref:Uncharacterized protein n=1 Tax=Romanomermis culicivorax TaxID=13658 RepID=A0A915KWA8_ROMCU